jgi:alkylated DNA repair protein (DNA oxidative demethylase)
VTLFPDPDITQLGEGVVIFRGAAEPVAVTLLGRINEVISVSPLRTVMTPMGKPMSVEMTNCGSYGWVSDRTGYRYETVDPLTSRPWPSMSPEFRECAVDMARRAGYADFDPDVCLINRYATGSTMGLHQDRDEQDFSQPIVSVSLGLPITFKFGGLRRTDRTRSVKLEHGDVVVFGGPARLAFHGVGTLRRGEHPLTSSYRFNLTFRVAN